MEQSIVIERMGSGAEAVGHLEGGKTVFIEGGAPGDVATIEIIEDKPSFARARIVQLDEASPARAVTACPQSALCGCCSWAHLSYETQLEAKRANVVAALVHTAHFEPATAEELVGPCLPSKREWGYRNKLELATCFDDRGVFAVGFHREGSHDIAPVDSCPLAHRFIAKAPKALRGALRYAQGSQDLGIFRIGVRGSLRTRDVEIALWTKPGPFPRGHVANTLKSALRATSIVRVLAEPGKERKIKGLEVLDGKGRWDEELAGARFSTSAPSFFQVNTAQAENLVNEAMHALDAGGSLDGAFVADLYAGGGTFSVPLALAGADVVAVESAGSSVRDLRRNADDNGVDIDIVGGDAARELPGLGHLDALVVDPPRAGLAGEIVESVAAAAPDRVVYISCNPITWARDVERFAANGYRLSRAQPVDLFPQTPHCEVCSVLSRRA